MTTATQTSTNQAPAPSTTNAHASQSGNKLLEPRVFLGICQVTIKSRGRSQKARALLDSGSHDAANFEVVRPGSGCGLNTGRGSG